MKSNAKQSLTDVKTGAIFINNTRCLSHGEG